MRCVQVSDTTEPASALSPAKSLLSLLGTVLFFTPPTVPSPPQGGVKVTVQGLPLTTLSISALATVYSLLPAPYPPTAPFCMGITIPQDTAITKRTGCTF